MNSLEIYNKLPEDYPGNLPAEINSNAKDSDFINLVKESLNFVISDSEVFDAQTMLPKFSIVYFSIINNKMNFDEGLAKSTCKFLISEYKRLLKNQRLGETVCNRKKQNYQLLNYYFQNLIDARRSIDKYLTSTISYIGSYKVWDAALINKKTIITVDSSVDGNVKVFPVDGGRALIAYSAELPTKVTIINKDIFVHSTYSNKFTLISDVGAKEYVHSSPTRVVFTHRSKIFFLDSAFNFYVFKDSALSFSSKLNLNGYFIDSYCTDETNIYCTSHTSSDVLIIDMETYKFSFINLKGVFMPNSIEELNGLFYVADKETGYISVFNKDFTLKDRFGYFSKKNSGNADTIKVLPRATNSNSPDLICFSWLKHDAYVINNNNWKF
jgi:hypothetical protein